MPAGDKATAAKVVFLVQMFAKDTPFGAAPAVALAALQLNYASWLPALRVHAACSRCSDLCSRKKMQQALLLLG